MLAHAASTLPAGAVRFTLLRKEKGWHAPKEKARRDAGWDERARHPTPYAIRNQFDHAARCVWRPSETSSMILREKASRSSGLREVTIP